MSLYLRAKGKILNSIIARPHDHWVNRGLDGFGRIAHKVGFGRYTPGLTREAYRLHKNTSSRDKIDVQKNGFYKNGVRVAGNKWISKRIVRNGMPTKFRRTEDDTPESIANYCRESFHVNLSRFEEFMRRRRYLTKVIWFSGLFGLAKDLTTYIGYYSTTKLWSRSLIESNTSLANFYGWFAEHSENNGKIPVEILQKIISKEKHLVIVPEDVIWNLKSPSDLRPWLDISKEEIWSGNNTPWFDKRSGQLVSENKFPVFWADAILPTGVDIPLTNHIKNLTSQSVIAGTTIATASTATSLISRRNFIFKYSILTLTAGALYKKPWDIAGRDTFEVAFRNALIAAKTLRLAEHFQESEKRPSFLLLLGAAHHRIMRNLKNGLEYNLEIIKSFRSLTQSFGPYWDKGYLIDPVHSELTKISIFEE